MRSGRPVPESGLCAPSLQHLFDYGPLHEAMNLAELAALDLGPPDVPKCPICGAKFSRTLLRLDFKGHLFGYFPADICEKGHDFLTDESDVAIEEIAQKLGLTGKPRARAV